MFVFVLKLLTFYAIFLMYDTMQGVEAGCCPGDKASSITRMAETGGKTACNQTSSLVKKQDWVMDLNITVFISNVMFVTTAENDDSAQVDIGTTSCDTFDDKACYITCSNLTVERTNGCYVTINVTCNVDNVKGRYVRIRKSNTTEEFALCHTKVAGWPSSGRELKNYALNASATQSTTYHFSYPSLAVDGDRGNLSQSLNLSCSQTATLDSNNTRTVHWWQVNLTKPILVSSIVIVNRWDKCCSYRLTNFTVELGRLESNGSITYTLCRYLDGVAGEVTNLTCIRSIWGQFVRISKMGDGLTLCEVEVYGDADNSTEGVPEMISEFNCNNLQTSNQTTTSFSKSENGVVTEDSSTTSNVSTVVQNWDASEGWTLKLEQSTSEVSATTRDLSKLSTGNQHWTTSQVSTGSQDRSTSQTSTGNQDRSTSQTSTGIQDRSTSQVSTGSQDRSTSQTSTGNQDRSTSSEMSIEGSTSLSPHKYGKQTRKKSSASDDRLSSATLGITGLSCILLAFGVMISSDVYRVCRFFFMARAKRVGRGIPAE